MPVNEAVNLGIAIYNMRQGEGIRHETLFRDETVGALDVANGKEYVRMLRRAMDQGDFTKWCLFATRHSFEDWRIKYFQLVVDAWSRVSGEWLWDKSEAGFRVGRLARRAVSPWAQLVRPFTERYHLAVHVL